MKMICGLGNPGDRYKDTRHNVGFLVVDGLLGSEKWSVSKREQAECASVVLGDEKVLLVKPQTYMNESGRAVRALADYYNIEIDDIWVVHDDLDLSVGRLKIKMAGSSGGHHGVDSVIQYLGTEDFLRFRVGVGKSNDAVVMNETQGAKYVTGKFSVNERDIIKKTIENCRAAIVCCLANKLEDCMTVYNNKNAR